MVDRRGWDDLRQGLRVLGQLPVPCLPVVFHPPPGLSVPCLPVVFRPLPVPVLCPWVAFRPLPVPVPCRLVSGQQLSE